MDVGIRRYQEGNREPSEVSADEQEGGREKRGKLGQDKVDLNNVRPAQQAQRGWVVFLE